MAAVIREVYDAFLDAGAGEEKAGAAARVLADCESRFDRIDLDLAEIKAQLPVIKWMLGLVLMVIVIPALKQFLAG